MMSVYLMITKSYFLLLQGEKIQTILKAANVDIEPYWPGLFAKALENVNIKDLITNIGSGVGASPAAGGGKDSANQFANSKKLTQFFSKFLSFKSFCIYKIFKM